MNPYALFLGKRDAIEVIAGTSQRLEDLAAALGPDGLERSPGPGKWSAREILCHLADCEVVFAFRIRQSLAEERHVIQPFDQDKWAGKYAPYDAHAALAVFSTVRKWNRTLIANLGHEMLSKTLNHPERGDMTFQVLLETMAGHDLNHIRQLESLARGA